MKETKFKQTEVGMIPRDWEVKTLEEVCQNQGIVRGPFGGALKKEMFVSSGYKVYEQKNAIYKRVDLGQYFVDASKYREMARFSIKPGDFIVSCSGTIGKIFKIPKKAPEGIINQALLKLSADEGKISSDYFITYFECDHFQSAIIDDTQGGAMKNLVGMDKFRKSLFILPPTIEEQQRIANVLSDVDTLINNLEKLIAKKKNIKQGAMQQLLTGKQRLSGFDGVWEHDKLGNIAEMNSGGTPSSENSHYYGGKIPFLSISDMTKSGKYIFVTEKSITQLGLDNSSARVYPAGTLLYAMYASLGKCSISKIDLAISQAILGFKLSNLIDRDFMYYYFCFIENTIKNIGQTGTQSNLSKSIVENFEIYHPHDVSEQQAIAKILSDMDTEIATLETKLAKYRKLKTGMMQQLLTGKIRLV